MKLRAWLTFTKERFDPISHLLMISLFFVGHYVVSFIAAGPDRAAATGAPRFLHLLCLFVGTTLFFFKLRLYDEIKDFEVDQRFNPHRPLVRGLLGHRDLYLGIGSCIALELLLFGLISPQAGLAMALAIGYSLLMYKEFFIGPYLRPHLTTYAVSHTVVTVLLSLAIFSALIRGLPWELPSNCFLFALNNWCLFNVFEFGRKTFSTSEEREGVESYSKIFGRPGAVLLVISQALIGGALIWRMALPGFTTLCYYHLAVLGVLTLAGGGFFIANKPAAAKAYRAMSSIYIVLIYLGFPVVYGRHFF